MSDVPPPPCEPPSHERQQLLNKRVPELTRIYREARRPLETLGVLEVGHFLEGEYAEWLVCKLFGLKRATRNTRDYDAEDTRGTRYQIKARVLRDGSKNTSWDFGKREPTGFNYMIGLIIEADWTVQLIICVDRPTVIAQKKPEQKDWRFRWSSKTAADERVVNLYRAANG